MSGARRELAPWATRSRRRGAGADQPQRCGACFDSAVTPGRAGVVEGGGIETTSDVGAEPHHELIVELED